MVQTRMLDTIMRDLASDQMRNVALMAKHQLQTVHGGKQLPIIGYAYRRGMKIGHARTVSEHGSVRAADYRTGCRTTVAVAPPAKDDNPPQAYRATEQR